MQGFLVLPNDKIVVAVSGGPDSVCLLYLLRQWSEQASVKLHVAHLNHGFREEAEEESRFVQSLSARWNIPITATALPVMALCKKRHWSKQEGARKIRYAFFQEVAQKNDAKWIAVGHTADDQAETFLMRVLRGAGMEGLSGIPPAREGGIIRPLLNVTRREIIETLSLAQVPFVQDPSNEKPDTLRNRIRHHLIPILEKYNPKIKETLAREATLLRDENDLIVQSLSKLLPVGAVTFAGDAVSFDLPTLQGVPLALRRRAVRWGMTQWIGTTRGISFRHIERVLERGAGWKGNQLPQGIRIEKRGGRRVLSRVSEEGVFSDVEIAFQLSSVHLPEWNLLLTMSDCSDGFPILSKTDLGRRAFFDFDKLKWPLHIRSWRKGDRFAPTGMQGKTQKLQDYFVNAKISRSKRHTLPILTSEDNIVWVIGHRVDARFQAHTDTRRPFCIEARSP